MGTALQEEQQLQYDFEDRVRAVARLLWDEAALEGATKLDGRERDGVFETRDTIHIVEATVSTKRQKAIDDGKKTHEAVIKLRKSSMKSVRGWLVTKNEPTADQRDAIKKKYSSTISIMSMEQFSSWLFRGTEYLQSRSNYRFGSIQDFSGRDIHVPEGEFVPTDFMNQDRTQRIPHAAVLQVGADSKPKRFLVLGEYGSGKSMALRAAFIERRKAYQSGSHHRCPIYLNLRDHAGQSSPVEALERHSRLVGYPGAANDLVRAWRAGFIDLLLDGFDEMATAGWGGSLVKVRSHRFAGMALVRNFLAESPQASDIFLSGRDNFFDTQSEMLSALGVGSSFSTVRTAEFSSNDLTRFLKKKGFKGTVPAWLPARPLLISYLIAEELLANIEGSPELDEAVGWHHLLDMIANREAAQDSRLDPETVRTLIERLATLARKTVDGLGNLEVATIQAAFQKVAGFVADEGSQQLLLRLPGLAPSSREDGTRRFVDESLASAAKAGDVLRFIEHPYGDEAISVFANVVSTVGTPGSSVLAARAAFKGISGAQVIRAAKIAAESQECRQVCSDILRCYSELNDAVEFDAFEVRSVFDEYLVFDSGYAAITNVTFVDCLFAAIEIGDYFDVSNLPTFVNCTVGSISGILGEKNLPAKFSDTDIDEYVDDVSTNAQVLSATLPEPMKVLVTILRKLFLQPGSGRQLSAFYRGAMDARTRVLVPEILNKVRAYGFAKATKLRGNEVWHPDRSKSSEARAIIFSPNRREHALVRSVLEV